MRKRKKTLVMKRTMRKTPKMTGEGRAKVLKEKKEGSQDVMKTQRKMRMRRMRTMKRSTANPRRRLKTKEANLMLTPRRRNTKRKRKRQSFQ